MIESGSFEYYISPYLYDGSASVMLVEFRTSSPRQYNSVLTCLGSVPPERPDAIRNCSNLFFQVSAFSIGCHHVAVVRAKFSIVLITQLN